MDKEEFPSLLYKRGGIDRAKMGTLLRKKSGLENHTGCIQLNFKEKTGNILQKDILFKRCMSAWFRSFYLKITS